MALTEETADKLKKISELREMENYEYALFKITDRQKFSEFMKKHLVAQDTEEFGYRVNILGCGKEPFEYEYYLDYLESVSALETENPLYLNFDEWVMMGRPKEGSEELSAKIEKELS